MKRPSSPGSSGWRAPLLGVLLATGLLAASLLDRVGWARLAQWREDQATNLWLGFTRGPLDLPVGLVSSVGVPNPNGMPLLGVVLSRLPGLLSVSWTLGAVQAGLVVALCFSLSLGLVERVALSMVLLSSVLLRAASVEFWNNWVFLSLNLAFALSMVRYLRRPSLAWLPVWTVLAVTAPSLYLAGLVNGLTYAAAGALLLVARPPVSSRATRTFALLASGLIVSASAWITWLPYARQVGPAAFTVASSVGLATRLQAVAISVVQSPIWWPFSWSTRASFVILQSSPEILSPRALLALDWALLLLAAQGLVVLASLAALAWRPSTTLRVAPRPEPGAGMREIAWIAGTVAFAYALSPLIGGPAWARGERMEMALQWLPLLLIVWFGGALVIPLPAPGRRLARAATLAIAVLVVGANVMLGSAIRSSYGAYGGSVLAPADVPLSDKVDAVALIAADWRLRQGGPSVPVDYDLGGGIWDWVPSFGRRLEQWYPAPMTLGRAFDYELLRSHGLANTQEGVERAPPGGGRYVVSYLALPPPSTHGREARHVPVGRLRVTIVDP